MLIYKLVLFDLMKVFSFIIFYSSLLRVKLYFFYSYSSSIYFNFLHDFFYSSEE